MFAGKLDALIENIGTVITETRNNGLALTRVNLRLDSVEHHMRLHRGRSNGSQNSSLTSNSSAETGASDDTSSPPGACAVSPEVEAARRLQAQFEYHQENSLKLAMAVPCKEEKDLDHLESLLSADKRAREWMVMK